MFERTLYLQVKLEFISIEGQTARYMKYIYHNSTVQGGWEIKTGNLLSENDMQII